MSEWETIGATDEWYTPKYIFDAIGEKFDLDVASPAGGPRHTPADCYMTILQDGLKSCWGNNFVFMNPPFGGRNGLVPWMDKFFLHGNGIALTPDRTSAPWWQDAAQSCSAILLTRGKVKFEKPDGSVGKSPSNGITLWASGDRAKLALCRASKNGLGSIWLPLHMTGADDE